MSTAMPKPVRRVVTGHDPAGKAVVVADGPAENVQIIDTARVSIAEMWTLPSVPTPLGAWEKRDPDTPMAISPAAGGLNFRVLRFDPMPADAVLDAETAFAEMGAPDAHIGNARHPAMHRTDTLDFGIIISGSVTLLLDEDDVALSAGDIVIQRGTNHAWENRGEEPCLMAVIGVDATRS